MDPSIVQLLEEDEEVKFRFSNFISVPVSEIYAPPCSVGRITEVDVETVQASLIRAMEGENRYSSQQFATGSKGCIGDANANLHRQDVFDSKHVKEQQRFVLGNQSQELKKVNESSLQHNRQLWENHCNVPQANDLNSRNNGIGNEPERPQLQNVKLQKMSSQQVHGVEQPIGSVNYGPTQAQICDFLRTLISHQNDKDKVKHYLTMYYKLKRQEMTTAEFIQQLKDAVGDQRTKLIIRNLHQGSMEIKGPGSPKHYRMSSASGGINYSEISAQVPDPRRVHVNQLPSTTSGTLSSSNTVQGLNKHPQQHIQLPSTSFHKYTNPGGLNTYPGTDFTFRGSSSRAMLSNFQKRHMVNNQNLGSISVEGPTNSTINMKTYPKYERPNSLNGPSSFQGGPISHFQNNSSLPLHSDPSRVGPSSSRVHLQQKLSDQSFDQTQKPLSLVQQGVDLPAASGTFPAGGKDRTTSKMPSVGRKKPLEELGSSVPQSRKKQKLRETSSDGSIEKFNDVTAVSGINLKEEENQLLFSGRKKGTCVSKASRRVVHEEGERTILQKNPLQRKLTDIMAKSGLQHMDHDVERCLSLCVEERMRGLLSSIIQMSKQRNDAEKWRIQTFITSDIRKEINEMNRKLKEEWKKEHADAVEEKVKNEENDNEKRFHNTKANKKEEDEWRRAKAANVAVHAAVGGDATFLKWKLMAEARQKSSSVRGRKSKKLSGETAGGTKKIGKNQDLRKEVLLRSISVKDVIAVVEKESQMSRSTLLYRLYNRICSDV